MIRQILLFACGLYLPCFETRGVAIPVKNHFRGTANFGDHYHHQHNTKWFFQQLTPVKNDDFTLEPENILAPSRKWLFQFAETGFQPPAPDNWTPITPPTEDNPISDKNAVFSDRDPATHIDQNDTACSHHISFWPRYHYSALPATDTNTSRSHRLSTGGLSIGNIAPARPPRRRYIKYQNVNKLNFPLKKANNTSPRTKRAATRPTQNSTTSFTAYKPAPVPLRVSNSVSIKYRHTYYYTANSKKLTVHLPFKDIIQTILGLYDFTATLNDNARLDSMQFREIQIKKLTDNNYLIRSYENYNYYADQTGLCSALNLSHINPRIVLIMSLKGR